MSSSKEISKMLETVALEDIPPIREPVPAETSSEIGETTTPDDTLQAGDNKPGAPPVIQNIVPDIMRKIHDAMERREMNTGDCKLVAVSKLQPAEKILQVYKCGVKHFGENYVNELVEKANHPLIVERCRNIKWHFIGHLQTNKVSKLLSVKRLWMVQTVDSKKLADTLDQKWGAIHKSRPLNVMIQVNTSGEEGKHGIRPDEVLFHIIYIKNRCPHLNLMGLMTIGSAFHDLSLGPNPDFETLVKLRNLYYEAEDIDQEDLLEELIQLSMGMSHDYEHAVEMGSDLVRIGRTIFGDRPKKGDPPKKEEDRPKIEDSHEEGVHAKEEDHPKEEEDHPIEEDHPKKE